MVYYLYLLNPIIQVYLAKVADQTGLSVTWSQTPEDRICHDVSHINY